MYELDAQMQALSQAIMQQPVGQRGPSPTLQQYMANLVHTIIQTTGAAAEAGANGGSGGVPEAGRPVQPVSPELQQQQQAPQQRMPDSPRQLHQQHAPPAANANAAGVFMPSRTQHQNVISAVQQQQHGSISFGSGNIPPIGVGNGVQQQQPGPALTRPAANGNHPPPPLPANEAERASSGEGWSSDSDEAEAEVDNNNNIINNNDDGVGGVGGGTDQPGAGAAAINNFQQQQEVVEIFQEDDDEETQPYDQEGDGNQQHRPNGQPRPSNNTHINRTRVIDSPSHETPIIQLGNNTMNRDDIESSSQEDGHRELAIPWNNTNNLQNRSSSGKKNKRKSESGLNSGELRRRSSSPLIMAEGIGGLPPTEVQDFPFIEDNPLAAAAAADTAPAGGGDDVRASSEKTKKQRLYSAGKSNMTTNIVLNTMSIGIIDAVEPSPNRAKAALIGDFDQVSNPLSLPSLAKYSPGVQLPAAFKVEQVSSLLMAHPPGLDEIKAGHEFEFPPPRSPSSPVVTADVAEPAELPRQQHRQQQQQEQKHEMVNNGVSIQEWGPQGPQPFTFLYHLANYIDAAENSEISSPYPISATVQGFIARIIDKGTFKDPVTKAKRLVIKVLLEDATGSVEAVLSENLVLDLINGIFRKHTIKRNTTNTTDSGNSNINATDGTGIAGGGESAPPIQASSVDDIFRLKNQYPELVKNALIGLKPVLQEHYGFIELMVHSAGEYPQIVQLLDLSLTSSQLEAQRGGRSHEPFEKDNR